MDLLIDPLQLPYYFHKSLHTSPNVGYHLGVHGYRKNASTISRFVTLSLPLESDRCRWSEKQHLQLSNILSFYGPYREHLCTCCTPRWQLHIWPCSLTRLLQGSIKGLFLVSYSFILDVITATWLKSRIEPSINGWSSRGIGGCSNEGMHSILIIDNRGGKRDWKHLYMYADDARHGHVTLTKFANHTITLHQQRLRLLPSRETWCTPAESSEVLKPKEERIGQFFWIDL